MKEGDKVVVTGSIEVYERDGKYQLYAREVELAGAGNLYLKFETLKRELEEMGMFDASYKKPIPKYAKRVGIVTAPTGAAIQDIRNIASRRNPYVQLILYPALVQGEGAAASVVNGIRTLDALGVDVMIVGRGGGSIEDLWAFNEEIVARAIFACETPVISAVGHETDTTIADYAADLRAPTPSAAAELAVFDYALVKEQIAGRRNQFGRLLRSQLGAARMRLSHIQTKIGYLSPMNKLRENRRYTAELQDRMAMQMQQLVEQKKHRLALLAGALEGLSPIKKLSMGYSYVSDRNGNAVTDAAAVKKGEQLKITLLHGAIMAQVQEILKEQENTGGTEAENE